MGYPLVIADCNNSHIFSSGLDYSDQYSHWNAKSSLGDWLKKNNVPAVFGIDTRALIKKIRHAGVMLGRVLQAKDKVRSGLKLHSEAIN